MRPIRSGYRVGKSEGGPKCEEFERALEGYYRVKYARVLNSATSALHAALVGVGVRPGDEVICPGLTMSGSAAAIIHAGARPVFADIGEDYCLDWADAHRRITDRTAAIMLVHLFGHHATLPDWAARFAVVHDAAQSPTLRPEPDAFGHAWVYSLNQWKIIQCGEGGYALARRREVANRIHLVRNHGECVSRDIVGHNYRMTEMQAAIALEEFNVLDSRMEARREWAEQFSREHGVSDPGNRDWFVFPVRCHPDERRDMARGLGGRVGYHRPIYKLPYFEANGYKDVVLPNVEKIESELVVVDPLMEAA